MSAGFSRFQALLQEQNEQIIQQQLEKFEQRQDVPEIAVQKQKKSEFDSNDDQEIDLDQSQAMQHSILNGLKVGRDAL